MEGYPEGTNLSGYFIPEAWMFAPGTRHGGAFPPALPADKWEADIGENWRSDGHLTTLLATKLGPQECIRAFESHWTDYAKPAETLRNLRERGVSKLRIPLPW